MDNRNTIADMAAVVAEMITKNKEQRAVTADEVMEWMDGDQLGEFVSAFMRWINDTKSNNPN